MTQTQSRRPRSSMQEGFETFEETYIPQACPECGNSMCAEAAFYYESCDECANESHDELQDWKDGNSNTKLDEMFESKTELKH
jgi:hypothetical protein